MFAGNQFVLRDSSGLTPNLQGVFGLNEGFAYGNNFHPAYALGLLDDPGGPLCRLPRTGSALSAAIHSLGDTFEAGLHKGYLKASYVNLELAFGRDTLWWGPASQGDLVISNNAPPFESRQIHHATALPPARALSRPG